MTSYSSWKNIVLYQTIWFGSVLGQNTFVAPVILLLCLHFYLCTDRRDEVLVVFTCASFGIFGDSVLSMTGVYQFTPEPVLLKIPMWLVAIWIGFTATLRHGLGFLMRRPWLAVPVAGIGAPFVYLAAARLGAVTFPLGMTNTAMIVSAVWMLQMGLFIIVIHGVASQSVISLKDSASSTVSS